MTPESPVSALQSNIPATGQLQRLRWDYILWAAALIVPFAATAFLKFGLAWPCTFKLMTGVPCATCGGTRALAALGHGHLLNALAWNPMVVLALFAFALKPFIRYRPRPSIFWPCFWTLLLANWIYLILFLPR